MCVFMFLGLCMPHVLEHVFSVPQRPTFGCISRKSSNRATMIWTVMTQNDSLPK